MHVQAYLYFNGKTDEALEFYKKAIGAQVEFLMRFKESPVANDPNMVPPGTEDKVMHASFKVGDTVVMASDGMCGGNAKFDGIAMTINADNPEQADKLFAALSEGGKVQMPLTETFFSPRFGMLTDKFGVPWMVIVPRPM